MSDIKQRENAAEHNLKKAEGELHRANVRKRRAESNYAVAFEEMLAARKVLVDIAAEKRQQGIEL